MNAPLSKKQLKALTSNNADSQYALFSEPTRPEVWSPADIAQDEAAAPVPLRSAQIVKFPANDPLSGLRNCIFNEECIEGMNRIPDQSIDMILCDLPYGTTQNQWDEIIPFDQLWNQYERVIKSNGAIVLTASQPFTSMLTLSNRKLFRYSLVWDKKNTTGHLNAKRMPMRRHEDICVFYRNLPIYNPQMVTRGKPRMKGGVGRTNRGCYGDLGDSFSVNNVYYPTSILEVSTADKRNIVHPTQKPTELFEYLINTYTNEGNTVLDSCIGSGTTALACLTTKRTYIGFENNKEYYNLAMRRIADVG